MQALFFGALILGLSSSMLGQQQFVHTSGKDIVTPDGKIVLLKGINLGNWLVPEGYMFKFDKTNAPRMIYELINQLIGPGDAAAFWQEYRANYITEEDIHFIKACGLNSIRVPFHYMFFIDESHPKGKRNEGIQLFDKLVKWCEKEKLYIIFDMHCAPGGQTGDNIDDSYGYPFLFESEASQNLAIKVWENIARRYKNNKIVIGYDVLNEPVAHYFDAKTLNPKLMDFYKKAVKAIRAIDKNHILFLGGAQWDSNLNIFEKPMGKNTVYTFHKYWTAPDQSVIQDYINIGKKQNIPLWLGESGENSNGWIDSFRVTLEKNQIGWCFWPYKKMAAPSCMASIQKPAQYDSLIKFAEGPRVTFDDLRSNRMRPELVKSILKEYLNNIRFKNCQINDGYLKALGVSYKK